MDSNLWVSIPQSFIILWVSFLYVAIIGEGITVTELGQGMLYSAREGTVPYKGQ